MKCSTICAAFFAAVVAASSDVVQLKTESFKEFVQENDLVLAECKSRMPQPPSRPEEGRTEHVANTPPSLRTMVRPLQGPGPRVRDGCHHT